MKKKKKRETKNKLQIKFKGQNNILAKYIFPLSVII